MPAAYSALDLGGRFSLTSPTRDIAVPITLPGDVHSALLAADIIPDPYFGENEKPVMWVNETAWSVERNFVASADDVAGYLTLTLAEVDCIATISLNGAVIAKTDNSFIRNDIDVTGKVLIGENILRIDFDITPDVAKARSDAHPFPIPFTYNYQTNGLKGIHMNFVRKAACHAGWDWGICLMPIGVYGTMQLRRSKLARQDSVQVDQVHGDNGVELILKTRVFAFADGVAALSSTLDGQVISANVTLTKGDNLIEQRLVVTNPRLWWPAGQGEQPLYELVTELDGEITRRHIGLPHQWARHHDDGRQLDSGRRHPLAHHQGGHCRPARQRQGCQYEYAAHLGRGTI